MLLQKKLLLLILISSLSCFSQNKNFIKHNDSLVGFENLAYNNGLVYYNKYKTTSNNTSQFLENKYSNGILQYNNQTYTDLSLKYDVFEDLLLFKPASQLVLETSLITKQVDYFILKNKKFRKIETISSDKTTSSGFFEEVEINEKCTLYIKHKKTLKSDFQSVKLSYIFYDYNVYYIFYNNKLEEISSKKSIINLFPTLKKEIKQFYNTNRNQRENNIQLFYQNLFKTII
ncbi:hypothetical protein [Flavobacterium terrigena]|uniref:DKNYY family protein n=1 Tax=Flavobacterium terrigena TaxID=402734 RepID=A0A1H6X4H7_9FLAO|nr:hypothetical protein [Flavobacterium terrigena]SEJ19475.1 hypothetical protein SAMN05660918_2606 [Flavobacterium terrigena]